MIYHFILNFCTQ